MRVLTYTSLYPSSARPRHGIFVETRLRHLVADTGIEARVIAPVPWFPFSSPLFGGYARFAATPRRDLRSDGLRVSYPRYLMLPKIGVAGQPERMAKASRRDLDELLRGGWRPDLIDAHYFYPDGVAAALLAQWLNVPFVVTARGTDVNVIAREPGPGKRILETADRAAAVIVVSTRLKESLVELGVDPDKITVLRNGVDARVFAPIDLGSERKQHQRPTGRIALCVGNLVAEKDFGLAIDVLARLPDWQLVIVGDGPMRAALSSRASNAGLSSRVRILPPVPQSELRNLYSTADVLLLTSTREGWPNVVLEALACGTPVASVDVGAVDQILTRPEVGRVVRSRDAATLAEAVIALAGTGVPRQQIRAHALGFDWTTVSLGQQRLFAQVLGRAASQQTIEAHNGCPVNAASS